MNQNTDDQNLLWQLAQTMISRDTYLVAIALRKLVQAGYTSLEEVVATSDWVLLATPGIGVGRLGIVRRLVEPEWQPPSHKAIQTATWFLSTARLALRFWSVEDLTSVIRGAMPPPVADRPIEKRLALERFSVAVRNVLRYDDAEAWILALQQVAREDDDHAVHCQALVPVERQAEPPALSDDAAPVPTDPASRDSDHYAFSAEDRRQIVEHYRMARSNGEVANKEAWAYSNYGITRKTLWRYEQEFPPAKKTDVRQQHEPQRPDDVEQS